MEDYTMTIEQVLRERYGYTDAEIEAFMEEMFQ